MFGPGDSHSAGVVGRALDGRAQARARRAPVAAGAGTPARAGDGDYLRRPGGAHGASLPEPGPRRGHPTFRKGARAHAQRSGRDAVGGLLRVDLHLHSIFSHDGQSSLDALIERTRECGLDRIALTDHNTAEGALELAKLAPELTIVGEEAKTREGELIGLFITRRVPPYLRPEEAMDLIHEMGGLTYLPHPLDRNRSHFRPERIVDLANRIDIIESYNPWCEAEANRAAARLAEELGKVQATGSDSHSADELGRSWMEVEAYSSTQDFLDKLRYARHVVTASSGTGRRA